MTDPATLTTARLLLRADRILRDRPQDVVHYGILREESLARAP